MTACDGTLSQTGTGETLDEVSPPSSTTFDPDAPLLAKPDGRKLSSREAQESLRDVFAELGLATTNVNPIPLSETVDQGVFSNTAASTNFSYDQIVNLMQWSESLSDQMVQNPTQTLGCAPSTVWDACASDFAERIGRLLWRRPLTETEKQRFEGLYSSIVSDPDATAEDGIRAMIEFSIMAPNFWYLSNRVHEGDNTFDDHAIAERLSYFIWGTIPDEFLRNAADRGELSTADQIRDAAQQMLGDPKAEEIVSRFHKEWLHTLPAFDLQKNGTLYPTFNEELASDFETEFDLYVRELVLEQGTLEEVFSGGSGFVNQRLERFYGLDPQTSGNEEWAWRELGPDRGGIFTRPLFLASTAGAGESNLIKRGNAIVRQALCWELEFDDAFLAEALPLDENASSGKLAGVDHRAANANCSSCHNTIDPIGIAFEAFDAIGATRDAYPDGVAIPVAGSIRVGDDIEYSNATDLMRQLSSLDEVKTCYASKWVEWITGFPVNHASNTETNHVRTLAQSSTIRELIIETAASDLFRRRQELQ